MGGDHETRRMEAQKMRYPWDVPMQQLQYGARAWTAEG
jgi:hypothetical protein